MSIKDVAEWLISDHSFLGLIEDISLKAAGSQISHVAAIDNDVVNVSVDWKYALYCASILCHGSEDCRAKALRIVEAALHSEALSDVQRAACDALLQLLNNEPTRALSIRRELIPDENNSAVPFAIGMDILKRRISTEVTMPAGETFSLNDFQRRAWDALCKNKIVSFSAATSSGKSFLLVQWISFLVQSQKAIVIVYIVPTRALITQVEEDLSSTLQATGAIVSTLPEVSEIRAGKSCVFVFTQERFHYFLVNGGARVDVDCVVFDEAHKIGDRHRGVVLQKTVDFVARENENVKMIFSTPLADNPEYFLPLASNEGGFSFKSEYQAVSQNLFWVSQAPRKPKEWNVSLCLPQSTRKVADFTLTDKPVGLRQRLAFIVRHIGGRSFGNIVYVNGAAEAENVADILAGLNTNFIPDARVFEAINVVKKAVHEDFMLARVLLNGVAVHYGNMPQIVRLEIEKLFREECVHTLVCTSTLVEGVNIGCKNLFIRGPQKGRGFPMSDEDFWNLAGRAGRLGREFAGNIFCIDPTDRRAWGDALAPTRRRPFKVRSSLHEVLEAPESLEAYMADDGSVRKQSAKNFYEYTLSYLAAFYMKHKTLSPVVKGLGFQEEIVSRFDRIVGDFASEIKVPVDIVDNNLGINPAYMESYLAGLLRNEVGIVFLAEPGSDDAVENYAEALGIWLCNLRSGNFVRGGALACPSVGRAPRMGYPPFRFSQSPKRGTGCRTPRVRSLPR